jgi:hypothetical protein
MQTAARWRQRKQFTLIKNTEPAGIKKFSKKKSNKFHITMRGEPTTNADALWNPITKEFIRIVL